MTRRSRQIVAFVDASQALISGALTGIGLSRLSSDALKPSVTLDQVRRDKVAAKEMAR